MFARKHQRRTNFENIAERSSIADEETLVLQAIDEHRGTVTVRGLGITVAYPLQADEQTVPRSWSTRSC